jgi:hypothetical protein
MKKRDSYGKNDKEKKKQISMNKELQKWLAEMREIDIPPQKTKDNLEHHLKKPIGKCQICGEKKAKATCLKCARLVCTSCYFKIIGVCKKCIPKSTVEHWEEKYPDWEEILGVKWVD